MHGKALIQKAPMVNRNKNNGRALEDNSGVLCLEGRTDVRAALYSFVSACFTNGEAALKCKHRNPQR